MPGRPFSSSFCSTSMATDDLPDPDSPVNHTVLPFDSRSSDGAQRFVAHRVRARRARGDVGQDHARGDGAVGVRVDQDERAGCGVAGVLVEQQRHLRAQRDTAQFVEFQRGCALVPVQGVDVEPVVQRGHLDPRGARGVLDDVVAAWFQRRFVGHPAHRGVEVLRHVRLVVRPRDHVAARDVDVVGQADRHRHRRERLRRRARSVLRSSVIAARLAGGQHDDLVAGAHDTAGDGARVAAVVGVLVGLRPDHVLHREPDVDEVAVTGDVDLFEVAQQRRALVPRA